jgi:hypothetical protein
MDSHSANDLQQIILIMQMSNLAKQQVTCIGHVHMQFYYSAVKYYEVQPKVEQTVVIYQSNMSLGDSLL